MERSFRVLMSTVLMAIILLPFIKVRPKIAEFSLTLKNIATLIIISCIIGLLSGIIGIGGGIILGPFLYTMGMSYTRIPAVTSGYIFINSTVGLFSRWHAHNTGCPAQAFFSVMMPYIPLVAVCAVGGLLSICVHPFLSNEARVKKIVVCVILGLAIYNFVKTIKTFGG